MKKTVIVTGGAQGIGKGIAKQLLKAGYAVVIADIDPEAGQETEAEYSSLGKIQFINTDVSNEDSVKECLRLSLERFHNINALVNNAGIAQACSGPIEELPVESWNKIISTNLTSCFLLAKHAVPSLRAAKGTIVNIASTRALQSEPDTEAYSASKGGIVALTHSLAVSLGPDIRVNCISPGWIDVAEWKKRSKRKRSTLKPEDHSQHPVGKVGSPEDIAKMVEFLISRASGFITGQNFVIDGGMTKKMIYID